MEIDKFEFAGLLALGAIAAVVLWPFVVRIETTIALIDYAMKGLN